MYQDFEDLRDNCPAEIKADIAIDFDHPDRAHLRDVWPATGDGEFRLALTSRVGEFWEREVRERGLGKVPEDGFACEMIVDSYLDEDMGATLFLELHAYCGTEGIGDLAWSVFEDDGLERRFAREMEKTIPGLFEQAAPGAAVHLLYHGLDLARFAPPEEARARRDGSDPAGGADAGRY